MKRALWLGILFLAACGADGPPIAPEPEDAATPVPAATIETSADRPEVDGDLGRPLDAADTTEEI